MTTETKFWNGSDGHLKCNKVNLGCGVSKWPNFINVDVDRNLNPDVICDIRFHKLPIEAGTITEVWCCHTLEHIQKNYWPSIFFEVNRVLVNGGLFYLTYPEFTKCYEFWLSNHLGKRDYWEACIYGRQASFADFHVSICHTPTLKLVLKDFGFGEIQSCTELEPQYTALKGIKMNNTITPEDKLRESIFGGSLHDGRGKETTP